MHLAALLLSGFAALSLAGPTFNYQIDTRIAALGYDGWQNYTHYADSAILTRAPPALTTGQTFRTCLGVLWRVTTINWHQAATTISNAQVYPLTTELAFDWAVAAPTGEALNDFGNNAAGVTTSTNGVVMAWNVLGTWGSEATRIDEMMASVMPTLTESALLSLAVQQASSMVFHVVDNVSGMAVAQIALRILST